MQARTIGDIFMQQLQQIISISLVNQVKMSTGLPMWVVVAGKGLPCSLCKMFQLDPQYMCWSEEGDKNW